MGSVLTTSDLLAAWERGLTEKPVQRALHLLASAYPDTTPEQLQELPIGQRDSRLLAIREALFGPQLTCLTACPKCGERLEIALDVSRMRSLPTASAGTHALAQGDFEVKFRLPNSADMLVIAALPEANQARQTLFERCIQQVTSAGISIAANKLPEGMAKTITDRMAEIDPQADIQIALSCPACGQEWSTAFDIVSYLWSEINTWAIRILREVHQLASAYGWREADILAMSSLRRQFYLELIG